jgi:hypothetical protein
MITNKSFFIFQNEIKSFGSLSKYIMLTYEANETRRNEGGQSALRYENKDKHEVKEMKHKRRTDPFKNLSHSVSIFFDLMGC